MPIDETKPADGVPADKSDIRANWTVIKTAIDELEITSAATAITVNAASFGEARVIMLRCTGATAITVTLAADVPKGRSVHAVRKGTGDVSLAAATFNKPASASAVTTELNESLIAKTEGATGAWLFVARP